MTERLPNAGESTWQNILGANDGSGGFLRVTLNDDGTLRPTLGQTVTASALTANTDNWNPTGLSTATVIRASSDATRSLTGIVAQTDGRAILLENVGSQLINVIHDQTSTAANRFYIGNNASSGDALKLTAGSSVWICYDNTAQRWRAISYVNPGDASPLTAGPASAGTSLLFSRQDHVHPGFGLIGDSGVLAASATTIDFTSISGSYAHIIALYYVRVTAAVATTGLLMRINNISTATYDNHGVQVINTTVSGDPSAGDTATYMGEIPGASATANIFGGGLIVIPTYAGASNKKMSVVVTGAMDTETSTTTNWTFSAYQGKNRATTAITRLTFGCGTFGTTAFAVGSQITLYGLGV